MGNIFDRLIRKRLRSFLNKYDVVTEFQNGFQNKSTVDVILELTEQKVEKLGVIVRLVCTLLDAMKAFDTVDHKITLEQSEICCLGGEVVKLLRSYLEICKAVR